jgi:hypothetical protein
MAFSIDTVDYMTEMRFRLSPPSSTCAIRPRPRQLVQQAVIG